LLLIKEAFELDDVGVVEMLRDFELAVLVLLVLQNVLNGEQAVIWIQGLRLV
jgi:hypothetical protein